MRGARRAANTRLGPFQGLGAREGGV